MVVVVGGGVVQGKKKSKADSMADLSEVERRAAKLREMTVADGGGPALAVMTMKLTLMTKK